MDCDRSALLKKAIKATARRLKNKHALAVAFFAFWAFSNYCSLMIVDFNYFKAMFVLSTLLIKVIYSFN